jgi:hypothetical protein
MPVNRCHTACARQIARWLLRALSCDVTFLFSDREGTVLSYGDDDIAGFLGLPAAARRTDATEPASVPPAAGEDSFDLAAFPTYISIRPPC